MSILSQLTTGKFPADRLEFFSRHIRPDGRDWSFDGHEYLRALVIDDARDIVVRKAAQLGVSTVAIGRMLFDCLHGRKVGYYLSDRAFMQAYVQDRIDPIINADPDIARATVDGKVSAEDAAASRDRRKSADNLRIKHIGTGSAWFQGLQKVKDAKSLDLDSLILDELNELDPEILPWLDDRLLHSTYKRRFSLSQCGVPDFGIDAEFQASDQKFFLLQCNRCTRWCNLIDDWPDCLVGAKDGPRIVCKRCGARVSIQRSRAHEWVPARPGRAVAGYAMSQLYGPACDASEVWTRWERAQRSTTAMLTLMVSIVGRPYAGDRQPLADAVLDSACGAWRIGPPAVLDYVIPEFYRQRPLRIAGIDTGDSLHVVAGQLDGEGRILVYNIAELTGDDQWDDLAAWLTRNGVTFFVADAQPYKSNVKRLCRTPGLHGAMAYFNAQDLTTDFTEPQHPQPIKRVRHERTAAIDEMAAAIVGKELLLPTSQLDVMTTVKAHCRNLVKDLGDDGLYHYKRGVENHYGLALTYMYMARRVAEMLDIGPPAPLGPVSEHLIGRPMAPTSW